MRNLNTFMGAKDGLQSTHINIQTYVVKMVHKHYFLWLMCSLSQDVRVCVCVCAYLPLRISSVLSVRDPPCDSLSLRISNSFTCAGNQSQGNRNELISYQAMSEHKCMN